MDPQQQEAFKQAVEDKKAEAAERAMAPHAQNEKAGANPATQSERDEHGQTQDVEPRDSNSRHRQVTADKWNQ